MPEAVINGANISYTVRGEGRPLVFINELFDSQIDWFAQVHHFSKNYQVITYDRRAWEHPDVCGRAYTLESHADDLSGLLDHLGIDKAYVVGGSLGGFIAQYFAVKYAERVAGLGLFDTGIHSGYTLGVRPLYDQKVRDCLRNYFDQRIMQQPCFTDPHENHWAKLHEFESLVDQVYNFEGVFGDINNLRSIKVPVLYALAEHEKLRKAAKRDEAMLLKWHAEAIADLIPHRRYRTIPNSYHSSRRDNSRVFNEKLEDFLVDCEEKAQKRI